MRKLLWPIVACLTRAHVHVHVRVDRWEGAEYMWTSPAIVAEHFYVVPKYLCNHGTCITIYIYRVQLYSGHMLLVLLVL